MEIVAPAKGATVWSGSLKVGMEAPGASRARECVTPAHARTTFCRCATVPLWETRNPRCSFWFCHTGTLALWQKTVARGRVGEHHMSNLVNNPTLR
jgi:hypothetical protein